MLSTSNLLLTLLLALISLSIACPDVEIIVAAGTFEKGEGGMGSLASLIASRVPNTAITSVPYPHGADFEVSEPAGVRAMNRMIKAHNTRCPNTKFVLLGYSQGAQVVMDTICGTRELTFGDTPQLTAREGRNLVASVVYGDLSRVAGKKIPYNKGTGYNGGIYPRLEPHLCRPFVSRMLSFCTNGDPFCDHGTDVAAHLLYFGLYNEQAADFVVDKINTFGK